MDTKKFLSILACVCLPYFCDGVPVGDQWRCPVFPCPPPYPHCLKTETTYYWYNQSSVQVLCPGCDMCVKYGDVSEAQPARRELDNQDNCESILCAPLPPTCTISATREPSQLTGKDGQPCPVCSVCLDYVDGLSG